MTTRGALPAYYFERNIGYTSLLACHSGGIFLLAGDAVERLKRFPLNDSIRGAKCNLICAPSSNIEAPA